MNYEIDLLHEINRDVEPHNLKITYKIEVLKFHSLFCICLYLATLKYSFKEFNVSTPETWYSQQIMSRLLYTYLLICHLTHIKQ